MTTPEQRKAILSRIGKAWSKNPALRLGQIIEDSTFDGKAGSDLLTLSDEELATKIEAWVKGRK